MTRLVSLWNVDGMLESILSAKLSVVKLERFPISTGTVVRRLFPTYRSVRLERDPISAGKKYSWLSRTPKTLSSFKYLICLGSCCILLFRKDNTCKFTKFPISGGREVRRLFRIVSI